MKSKGRPKMVYPIHYNINKYVQRIFIGGNNAS